ncbi:hypothetical protein C3L33_02874, partial [Rhododendron williamsianum]
LEFHGKRDVFRRVAETDTEPERNSDETKDQIGAEMLDSNNTITDNGAEVKTQVELRYFLVGDNVEVASGSPLPGVKPQQFDESMRIPKETIDILRDQVFGFDTFFVTSQEPYEGGLLFKGNLRGQAARSYEKITKRLEDKFGDLYKLFLLVNPEDDKPIAVVVPRRTLQPETAAVPEWFAAGAFGLVTVFTLLLRNVPALQSNYCMSTFNNLDLLKDGLPGALVTALILGVHEIGQILVAKNVGVKLGVPFFVPSWQIGCFGAITRVLNIVPKREDLLKVAAAGPLAGFSLGFVLLLLGFFLPPSDGLGVVVDASVFHESLLVGGLAKLLLGDVLKEGTPLSLNPLVYGHGPDFSLMPSTAFLQESSTVEEYLLLFGEERYPIYVCLCVYGKTLGLIRFFIWQASSRLTAASIVLLGLSSLINDVAFYFVVLIFFLQRGPIAPLSEEITDPDNSYVAIGVSVLLFGLLVYLPYPFPFSSDAIVSF